MKTKIIDDAQPSPEDGKSKKWSVLYWVVVAALVGQVAFYAWLTQYFG